MYFFNLLMFVQFFLLRLVFTSDYSVDHNHVFELILRTIIDILNHETFVRIQLLYKESN